jgi:hypothetical protein
LYRGKVGSCAIRLACRCRLAGGFELQGESVGIGCWDRRMPQPVFQNPQRAFRIASLS